MKVHITEIDEKRLQDLLDCIFEQNVFDRTSSWTLGQSVDEYERSITAIPAPSVVLPGEEV